jgi:hypothetical protein
MRARYRGAATTKACICGCGLVFRVAPGRRYHPQCAKRPGERDEHGIRFKDRGLVYDLDQRRCEMCEDMPHRRVRPRCPVCDEPFEEEVIEPVDVGPSCALGSL